VRRGARQTLLRIATAAVVLPPLYLVIDAGGLAAAALFGTASAICAAEYYRMSGLRLGFETIAGVTVAAALPAWPTLAPAEATSAAFWTIVALSSVGWIARLARGSVAGSPVRVGHLLAGVLFAGGGLFALALIRAGDQGREWTLALLATTWANDTGAYTVGKLAGRHKLAPQVSPGKSWEGLVGGAIGSLAGVVIMARTLFTAMSPADAVTLVAVTSFVGPVGDLCKSLLKRAHGVKDSGRLFPGHGGMLDRIDAVVLNSLVLLACLTLRSPG
jgi:phosphatidate cytidylyltransferase